MKTLFNFIIGIFIAIGTLLLWIVAITYVFVLCPIIKPKQTMYESCGHSAEADMLFNSK